MILPASALRYRVLKVTKMKTSFIAAIAGLSLFASMVHAEITVSAAKAFETAPSAMAGGGFMTITNSGSTDDVLLAVRADFPRVELHTTEFDNDIARMVHVDNIPVAAGDSVMLKPGGLHVMFMGLQGKPLVAGETIAATLIFEQAGEVPVTFEIVKRDMAAHNH
jgi:periplasmic copper chaperone A